MRQLQTHRPKRLWLRRVSGEAFGNPRSPTIDPVRGAHCFLHASSSDIWRSFRLGAHQNANKISTQANKKAIRRLYFRSQGFRSSALIWTPRIARSKPYSPSSPSIGLDGSAHKSSCNLSRGLAPEEQVAQSGLDRSTSRLH